MTSLTPNQLRQKKSQDEHKEHKLRYMYATNAPSNSQYSSPIRFTTKPKVRREIPANADSLLTSDTFSAAYRLGKHPVQTQVDADRHRTQWMSRQGDGLTVGHVDMNEVPEQGVVSHPALGMDPAHADIAFQRQLSSCSELEQRYPQEYRTLVGKPQPQGSFDSVDPVQMNNLVNFQLLVSDNISTTSASLQGRVSDENTLQEQDAAKTRVLKSLEGTQVHNQSPPKGTDYESSIHIPFNDWEHVPEVDQTLCTCMPSSIPFSPFNIKHEVHNIEGYPYTVYKNSYPTFPPCPSATCVQCQPYQNLERHVPCDHPHQYHVAEGVKPARLSDHYPEFPMEYRRIKDADLTVQPQYVQDNNKPVNRDQVHNRLVSVAQKYFNEEQKKVNANTHKESATSSNEYSGTMDNAKGTTKVTQKSVRSNSSSKPKVSVPGHETRAEADMIRHIDNYSKGLLGTSSTTFTSSASKTVAALEEFVSKLPARSRQRVTQITETQSLLNERVAKRQAKLERIEQAYNEVKELSKETGLDGRYASYVLSMLRSKLQDKIEHERAEEDAFSSKQLIECDNQQRGEQRVLNALRKKHQQALANRGLQQHSLPGSGGANYSTNKILREEGRRIDMRGVQTELRRDTMRYQETRRKHLDEKLSARWINLAELSSVNLLRQYRAKQQRQAQQRKDRRNGDRMMDAQVPTYRIPSEEQNDALSLDDCRPVSIPRSSPVSVKEITKYTHQHPNKQSTSLLLTCSPQQQRWTDTRSLFISPTSRPSPFLAPPQKIDSSQRKIPNYMKSTKVAQNRQKTTRDIIHNAYDSVQRSPVTSVRPCIDSVLTKQSPHHIKNMTKK